MISISLDRNIWQILNADLNCLVILNIDLFVESISYIEGHELKWSHELSV